MNRSGGRILVDQLALHGADLAFGVPGESYIDVLDALRDSERDAFAADMLGQALAEMRWT